MPTGIYTDLAMEAREMHTEIDGIVETIEHEGSIMRRYGSLLPEST